jgi:hypothetical protein
MTEMHFQSAGCGFESHGAHPSDLQVFWTRQHKSPRILGGFLATGNGAGTDWPVIAAGGPLLWERAVDDRLWSRESAGLASQMGQHQDGRDRTRRDPPDLRWWRLVTIPVMCRSDGVVAVQLLLGR